MRAYTHRYSRYMSSHTAVVTLLTSDSYLPGCLVTLYSLLNAEPTPRTFDTLCLITPSTLSPATFSLLRDAFDHVIPVDDIRSQSLQELAILGRKDLLFALTKLHAFRLTQYSKVIYLDSDVLVLRPISHLFELKHEFSAVPDIGWPDCFNSGVMVFTPNYEWFDLLVNAVSKYGTWDGADQGLLNDFFSGQHNNNNTTSLSSSTSTSASTISCVVPAWNRLSYTYNVTPSAYYSFVPAFLRYLPDVSIVHFIGSNKPWNRRIRPPYSQDPTDVYNQLLHRWYDSFESHHGKISTTDIVLNIEHEPRIIPASEVFERHYDPVWDSSSPTAASYNPPSPKSLAAQFPVDLSQFPYLDTKSLSEYRNDEENANFGEESSISMTIESPQHEESDTTTFTSFKSTSFTSSSLNDESSANTFFPPSSVASTKFFSSHGTEPQKESQGEYFPPPQSEQQNAASTQPVTAEGPIVIPEYASVWDAPVSEDVTYHPPSPCSVARTFSANVQELDYLPQLSERRSYATALPSSKAMTATSTTASSTTRESLIFETKPDTIEASESGPLPSVDTSKKSSYFSPKLPPMTSSVFSQRSRSSSPTSTPTAPAPEPEQSFRVFPWEIEGRSLPPPTRVFHDSISAPSTSKMKVEKSDEPTLTETVRTPPKSPTPPHSPPPQTHPPIFPWEAPGYIRAAPERVFSDDYAAEENDQDEDDEDDEVDVEEEEEEEGEKEEEGEENHGYAVESPSTILFKELSSRGNSMPLSPVIGQKYTNAWDEISQIGRDVEHINKWLSDQRRAQASATSAITSDIDASPPIQAYNYGKVTPEVSEIPEQESEQEQQIEEEQEEEQEDYFLSMKPKRSLRRDSSSKEKKKRSSHSESSVRSKGNSSEEGDDEKEEGEFSLSESSKYRQRRRSLSEDELQRRLLEQKRQHIQRTSHSSLSDNDDDDGNETSPRVEPTRVFSAQTDPERIKKQRLKTFQRLTHSAI